MNCTEFDRRLDALLDGTGTEADWREAEEHLAACDRCRGLFAALAGRSEPLDSEGGAALTASVLARTSGGTCGAARRMLCDMADGLLAPDDLELVRGHLARCAPCAALAAALERADAVLPSFAELRPPEELASRVLAATSRRPPEPAPAERLAAWLARAARRPRFSIEVAYVCTLLLLVAFGDPVRAFRDVSARVQPRVEDAARAVGQPLTRLRSEGAGKVAEVASVPLLHSSPAWWTGASRWLSDAIASLRRWWSERVDVPARALAAQAWRRLRTIVDMHGGPDRAPERRGVPAMEPPRGQGRFS